MFPEGFDICFLTNCNRIAFASSIVMIILIIPFRKIPQVRNLEMKSKGIVVGFFVKSSERTFRIS